MPAATPGPTQPPQLALFDAMEQQHYCKLSPDVLAPHPICQAKLSHSPEKPHFGHLCPQPCPFSHYSELMAIVECDWADPCFPFWSHPTVYQNFFDTSQNSFSTASPNLPHLSFPWQHWLWPFWQNNTCQLPLQTPNKQAWNAMASTEVQEQSTIWVHIWHTVPPSNNPPGFLPI